MNFAKYDKEEAIYQLYLKHQGDFDSIKSELIRLEMEIQHERNVPVWQSMYQLICDSHAASLYVAAFIDRKKGKDFDKDLDDGSKDIS